MATLGGTAKVIHSGHFMISNPHRLGGNSSDDDDEDSVDNERNSALQDTRSVRYASPRPAFRSAASKSASCPVDQSLNRLFQCLSLAYKYVRVNSTFSFAFTYAFAFSLRLLLPSASFSLLIHTFSFHSCL
jgi:hypothetical protein